VELEIPLPPERDSTTPVPTAPKPESLKETRADLLAALLECKQSLRERTGMEIIESATSTIRLAQRYRAQIRHEDWEDDKKLRRDAVDVLVILKRIAERDGSDVTDDEKAIIIRWCKDIKARVDRDDEARREMWERAAAWMDGGWEGNEWGMTPTMTVLTQNDIICSSRSSIPPNQKYLHPPQRNSSIRYEPGQSFVLSIIL
jgi:hypothetical protein